jgi:dTDP-4-amino-4,6-dideoxygalactose transaminase
MSTRTLRLDDADLRDSLERNGMEGNRNGLEMTKISIPIIDLAAGYQRYREEIDARIARVLSSGWYILGEEVARFEKEFAAWLGVDNAVGVANGTDAINLALRSLNVGPGDAVFTVSHTAVATVAAIEMSGATPVVIDVDASSQNIDLGKLSESVRNFSRISGNLRPKAVVAVHLYGQSCDMNALRRICEEGGLHLIEDCAQAHGTTFGGARAGSFGAAAAFSFYPTKNLGAFGDAGAVVFRDSAAATRCRALREYGWTSRYVSEFSGINSRLDEFQAAVLSVKLTHLDGEIARRRSLARRYDAGLAGVVETPSVLAGSEHAYHLYVIRCAGRDALRSCLQNAGIGSGIHYPVPAHLQPAYRDRIPLGLGGLAVTESLAGGILSLPMHPFLNAQDVDRVVGVVKDWAGAR